MTSSGRRSAELPSAQGSRVCRDSKILEKASGVEGGGMVVVTERGRCWAKKRERTRSGYRRESVAYLVISPH